MIKEYKEEGTLGRKTTDAEVGFETPKYSSLPLSNAHPIEL